jgi:hypothetical protein
MVDPALISATAALAGAAIGGIMSLLASWLVNQKQVRAQWFAHERSHREDLYKEFIEEAAKCYVDALQHDKPDTPKLVVLYAKLSRMRVLSSPRVVASAEQLITQIVNTYSEPNRTLTEFHAIRYGKYGSLDIVRNFSESCREEFDHLRVQQL